MKLLVEVNFNKFPKSGAVVIARRLCISNSLLEKYTHCTATGMLNPRNKEFAPVIEISNKEQQILFCKIFQDVQHFF
jgi:hypothetical protein